MTQHVFVDFENMKTLDLDSIGKRPIDFEVVFGPQDKKLDLDLVVKLMEHSDSVKLIRSPKAGNNAADFVLAFCLGQSVLRNPRDRFHVVSKDGGFNSLVELLTAQGVSITRHGSWNALRSALSLKQVPAAPKVEKKAAVKKVAATVALATPPVPKQPSLAERRAKVIKLLTNSPKSRPGTLEKLESVIVQHLNLGTESGIAKTIIEELQKSGIVTVEDEGKAVYNLPEDKP